MFGLGLPELILILLILLLLFGSKRLPELTKSIGEAVSELQKGLKSNEVKSSSDKKSSGKSDKN